jgi:predicted amino acid racemase
MLDGGALGLADARISNVERLRNAGMTCPISMIRTPMLSQVDKIVQFCDISYNTEIDVIAELAAAAGRTKTVHNIILMVEMGDMREGIMPENLTAIARQVLKIPGVAIKGIATNFACLSGVAPDASTMADFSTLTNNIQEICGPFTDTISGGNSANLAWALGYQSKGRINNLRLGEAILLGNDPVTENKINGLYGDAFTLFAEVIETKLKPKPVPPPAADLALSALSLASDNAHSVRSIIAIGLQDTDIAGLTMPVDVAYLGTTSDHLVIQTTGSQLRVGSELKLQMNYSALMRAMNATDITKVILDETPQSKSNSSSRRSPPALVGGMEIP